MIRIVYHIAARNSTPATRIAVRHAMTIAGGDQEFVAVGYSNGALLALNYALQCDDDEDLRCPDKLIFLSPAISVTQASMTLPRANW